MSTKHHYDTEALWRQDLDHYIHPWTDFSTFKEEGSLIMAESEGAYVVDSEGNRYIDGIGGLWCVNIGYANEEMAQAIAEQVRRITYYSTFTHITTPPAAELAAKLAELTPGKLNHVFYGTGGSMSNDTAIRIIHFYFNRLGKRNKKKIISRTDGYHGSTYLAMTLTGIEFDHQGFDLVPDLVHHIPAPNPYRRPDGMSLEAFCDEKVADLENKILELGPENVACFIAEPIMGAGGVIVPPPGYHRRTREVCDRYEVLYISDEVVTGFGRLGHFFASESVFDFVPDIITCAKGISSGYVPLSATLLSEAMYDVISVPQSEGAMFTHGFTYSGHPAACAVAKENIRILKDEKIIENVENKAGPYLQKRWKELGDHPLVGETRGVGMVAALELVKNKETREAFPEDMKVGTICRDFCFNNGLIMRAVGDKMIISPPLVLTHDETDELVDKARLCLDLTAKQLGIS